MFVIFPYKCVQLYVLKDAPNREAFIISLKLFIASPRNERQTYILTRAGKC